MTTQFSGSGRWTGSCLNAVQRRRWFAVGQLLL